jgi:uncharacterized protein YkwD
MDLFARLLEMLGLGAAPAPAPAPPPAAFRPRDLVDAMNAERARYGLRPLDVDTALMRVAQDWAEAMAARGSLGHEDFKGRIKAATPFSTAGEDVDEGQASVAAVMRAWMASPSHRANILDANFDRCGVGMKRARGICWWAAEFIER